MATEFSNRKNKISKRSTEMKEMSIVINRYVARKESSIVYSLCIIYKLIKSHLFTSYGEEMFYGGHPERSMCILE